MLSALDDYLLHMNEVEGSDFHNFDCNNSGGIGAASQPMLSSTTPTLLKAGGREDHHTPVTNEAPAAHTPAKADLPPGTWEAPAANDHGH